ncbi:hypothetical protein H5185_12130 [Shewanella sp. SG44-6]|jgi:hypothetical protein|uniref:hypothetical protein n=1 Tax=Shewanella sp. SG44-6 TaxID=2760959 RepID=UPI0015FF30A7|nr:hypothetical protein [Shewanella sp. SG44-6]MBB1390161.1 hypothetical protein [Shewanella sp. SG44-6]
MYIDSNVSLLPCEQIAKLFVINIGIQRAHRLLDLVTNRIKRRIDAGNAKSFGQFLDESCIRRSPWEVDLMFNIKMGLSLTDDYNTPAAARGRILKRISDRKLKEHQKNNKKP